MVEVLAHSHRPTMAIYYGTGFGIAMLIQITARLFKFQFDIAHALNFFSWASSTSEPSLYTWNYATPKALYQHITYNNSSGLVIESMMFYNCVSAIVFWESQSWQSKIASLKHSIYSSSATAMFSANIWILRAMRALRCSLVSFNGRRYLPLDVLM